MAAPPCSYSDSKRKWQQVYQPEASMEFLFHMDVAERDTFLRLMMQTFDLTYICLWSHLDHPSSCLQSLCGIFQEGESSQQAASSSSGSRARELFDVYRGSGLINVDFTRVPGLAFRNKDPYIELKLTELQTLAYSHIQLQFYQEARIQTVVFMGCNVGEIELGMSCDPPMDLKLRLEGLFSLPMESSHPIDPNQQPPSSSSSSLHSLSVDSPEYPSLLFNIPTTSFFQESPISETLLQEALRAASTTLPPTPAISSTHSQAIRTLSQMRSVPFPIASEHAEMTKAILAVIRSPSQQTTSQNVPPIGGNPELLQHNRGTAFRGYRNALAPVGASTRKHSMFKRAVLYLRNMEVLRRSEQSAQAQGGNPRPMTVQSLQHTIQERRRRKKINDSLQVLKSLVPPGSKKDKASVLSSTTDYLRSLQSTVAELIKKNQMLESQLKSVQKPQASSEQKQTMDAGPESGSSSSGDQQRVNVQITNVSSSSSEARFLDLTVAVRGEHSMLDLVIRILEFLKLQRNLSLMSVESNFRMSGQNIPVHEIKLRLRIEGDEFDEATFQEAVRRAVDE